MPPHCDSMDGPVVTAAQRALAEGRVEMVLPYAPREGEDEIREAFAKVMSVREGDGPGREIADRWFFETVVRIHRAGEGAAFTGLKPAGLGHGPVIPVAQKAIETGDVQPLLVLLQTKLREEIEAKSARVIDLRASETDSLEDAREYVEAMLGFEVWSHKAYECIAADPLHDHGSMANHRA